MFAGGCFWGVQGVFQHVKGVSNAVSGYIGGSAANARYEHVSGGQTGHAEAVKIDYDPRQVSYGQLMQVFFSVAHDPTQLNRQGPDHGSQYRSAIFSDDARQQAASRAYITQLGQAGSYRAPIVTQLVSGQRFYPAESYHQNYMTNYPQAAYIRYYDAPKLAALASNSRRCTGARRCWCRCGSDLGSAGRWPATALFRIRDCRPAADTTKRRTAIQPCA